MATSTLNFSGAKKILSPFLLYSKSLKSTFEPKYVNNIIFCRHKWRTFGYQRFLPKVSQQKELQELEENEHGFSDDNLKTIIASKDGTSTIDNLLDPYAKCHKKCILCEHNLEPEYKNVQLLSQFISPYTGRIYGRHVTGLCLPMQRRVSHLISRARRFGLMAFLTKNPEFYKDPKLFNPFKSQS